MKLRYVVITSVNRDDLPDGGSMHWAETVRAVRKALPDARVEVLTPDFCGNMDAVARVLDAGPHVFNHNMETIAACTSRVRPQANYRQSLRRTAIRQALSAGHYDQIRADGRARRRRIRSSTVIGGSRGERRGCRDDRPISPADPPQSSRGRVRHSGEVRSLSGCTDWRLD